MILFRMISPGGIAVKLEVRLGGGMGYVSGGTPTGFCVIVLGTGGAARGSRDPRLLTGRPYGTVSGRGIGPRMSRMGTSELSNGRGGVGWEGRGIWEMRGIWWWGRCVGMRTCGSTSLTGAWGWLGTQCRWDWGEVVPVGWRQGGDGLLWGVGGQECPPSFGAW